MVSKAALGFSNRSTEVESESKASRRSFTTLVASSWNVISSLLYEIWNLAWKYRLYWLLAVPAMFYIDIRQKRLSLRCCWLCKLGRQQRFLFHLGHLCNKSTRFVSQLPKYKAMMWEVNFYIYVHFKVDLFCFSLFSVIYTKMLDVRCSY